jgi:hypothetical protein
VILLLGKYGILISFFGGGLAILCYNRVLVNVMLMWIIVSC